MPLDKKIQSKNYKIWSDKNKTKSQRKVAFVKWLSAKLVHQEDYNWDDAFRKAKLDSWKKFEF
tara:strand:+ start:7608 stop:7796 length:189 start_codon:yes stop_codon:yes gene_type:complete